jgi:hypothetical protein
MFSHLQVNVRRHTILLGDEIISFMNVWNKPVCKRFIYTREWAINFVMWDGTIILALVKSSLCLMTWWEYLRTVERTFCWVTLPFSEMWRQHWNEAVLSHQLPQIYLDACRRSHIVCICSSVLAAALTAASKLSKANISREDANCSLRQILLMATFIN